MSSESAKIFLFFLKIFQKVSSELIFYDIIITVRALPRGKALFYLDSSTARPSADVGQSDG